MSVRPATLLVARAAYGRPAQRDIRRISKFDLYSSSPIPKHKLKFIPERGTYPIGFTVSNVKAGIKPDSSPQSDLVLVASDRPSCGAAVFTKNEFAAPSITVSREIMRKSKGHEIRGIIANSGCANLFMGEPGLRDTRELAAEAAKCLAGNGKEPSVLVMHTGAGGQR